MQNYQIWHDNPTWADEFLRGEPCELSSHPSDSHRLPLWSIGLQAVCKCVYVKIATIHTTKNNLTAVNKSASESQEQLARCTWMNEVNQTKPIQLIDHPSNQSNHVLELGCQCRCKHHSELFTKLLCQCWRQWLIVLPDDQCLSTLTSENHNTTYCNSSTANDNIYYCYKTTKPRSDSSVMLRV